MTFTVALLIFALGVLIGHHLHRPLGALRTLLRRRRYQWEVLRPWTPGPRSPGAKPKALPPAAARSPTQHAHPSRGDPPHA